MSKPKKRLWLTLLITCAGIGVLITVLFVLRGRVRAVTENMREKRTAILIRSGLIRNLAELKKTDVSQIRPYLTVLYNVLPQKDELLSFSQDVQALAQAERLDFGFSFGKEKAATQTELGSIIFLLNVKSAGGTGPIVRFIEKLEAFRYLTKLNGITITRASETQYLATIRGEVFYRP